MKSFLLLAALFSCLSFSFGQNNVVIEFTGETTFDDLVETRKNLAEKNIVITYKSIGLDEQNNLNSIKFEIFTEGPAGSTFGSGKLEDFSQNGKITVQLNYTIDDPSININVMPFGPK